VTNRLWFSILRIGTWEKSPKSSTVSTVNSRRLTCTVDCVQTWALRSFKGTAHWLTGPGTRKCEIATCRAIATLSLSTVKRVLWSQTEPNLSVFWTLHSALTGFIHSDPWPLNLFVCSSAHPTMARKRHCWMLKSL
jgi:hypothetical protein